MAPPRARNVALAEGAERDLEDIYRFIARQDSPAHAETVLRGLEDACAGLARLPERGAVPKELRSLGVTEFREVHSGPYRGIYRVIGRRVIVYCAFDGRRDVQSLLQRRLLR